MSVVRFGQFTHNIKVYNILILKYNIYYYIERIVLEIKINI